MLQIASITRKVTLENWKTFQVTNREFHCDLSREKKNDKKGGSGSDFFDCMKYVT